MASGDHLGGLQEMMANVLQQMAHQMNMNDGEDENEVSIDEVDNETENDPVHDVIVTQQPPTEDSTQQLSRNQEGNVEYLTELWQDLQRLDNTEACGFNHARYVIMREIDRVWGEMCYQDMHHDVRYAPYTNSEHQPAYTNEEEPYANPHSDQGLWIPPNPQMPNFKGIPPMEQSQQPEFVKLEEMIAVPSEKYPNYNFIGRILGPRGMSVKQLEQETGCRILVRGKGSVRDVHREQRLIGKKGWEHLSMPLHISVSATAYTRDAANVILQRGVLCISKLLCPAARDECKRRQLMELAIINGNYRPVLYESYVPHV